MGRWLDDKNIPRRRISEIYLPKGVWYDFWTGRKYEGKRFITVSAPLEKIPLFVKAGSIVPMMDVMQHVFEKPIEKITVHSYAGVKNSFELYEDDGVSYNYENGAFVNTFFDCLHVNIKK